VKCEVYACHTYGHLNSRKRGPNFVLSTKVYQCLIPSFSGKIDVGRYPDVGTKYHINTTALTRQLPTLILFENGKEAGRVPAIISGKVQKFVFKEEDIVNIFDLVSSL
jgi:hypothetical protein